MTATLLPGGDHEVSGTTRRSNRCTLHDHAGEGHAGKTQAHGERRAVAGTLAGAAVAGIAGVGVTWLVARGLGPLGAGAFFAATAAFTLAGAVARLGTQTGLVYWPARLRGRGELWLIRPCLRIGLVPVLLASFALAAVLIAVAPALADATAGPTQAAGYATELRALAIFLPLAALADAALAATRGLRLMRPTVLLDRIARPLLQLAAIGALAAWVSATPTMYALAWSAPYALIAAGSALALRQAVRRAAPAPACAAAPAPACAAINAKGSALGRDFWRFTGPRAAASVAQSALQRVDVLLVAALGGLVAAATYAVASRFLVLGQAVNQAISQVVQPRLAELLSTGARAEANALYQMATGWLVLATWPIYLLVIGFAPFYLGLFGGSYAAGATAVVILASAMLVATGCGMVDMVLAMAGRTSWNLVNVVLALAVNLGANLALIPRYGVTGAAVALALAVLTNNLVPLIQVAAALRLHPFGVGTLAAGALAVGCFGVLPLVIMLAAGSRPAALGAAAVLAPAAYLAGVFRLRRVLALDAATRIRRAKET